MSVDSSLSATNRPLLPWTGLIGGVLVVVALLGLLAVAPSAKADGDRGQGYERQRSGVSFSIGIGDRDSNVRVGIGYDHRQANTQRRVRTSDHVDRQGRPGRIVTTRSGHSVNRGGHDGFRTNGGYEHRRNYSHDRHRGSYGRHDRGHVQTRPAPLPRHRETVYQRPVRHHQPAGRWTSVWCPPVYRTVYDGCGGYSRVCVRAGYYKRVYVRVDIGHRY